MLKFLNIIKGKLKLEMSFNRTTTVEISILNVNDNSPKFIDSYNFTVMEDAQVSTIIGMIHATDDDGDNITYSLANVTSGI